MPSTSAAPSPVCAASPNATCCFLAALGGSLGALLAQQLLRHKTRKQPFRGMLIAIVVMQIGLATVVVVSPEVLGLV